MPERSLAVVVLAAGQGTRMKSSTPKVLHRLCGKPMIEWVVDSAREAGATRVVAIVRPGDGVAEGLPDGVEPADQRDGEGTGAAVTEDDLVGRNLLRDTVTSHLRLVLTDDGQPIQRALRADLLNDSDATVRDDQQPEHAVDHRTGREHDDQQHPENCVDSGEHIAPDDVANRT